MIFSLSPSPSKNLLCSFAKSSIIFLIDEVKFSDSLNEIYLSKISCTRESPCLILKDKFGKSGFV
ncbi:MAG TPA: hypothetical protein PLW61_07515 [Caldisericia bacterium]|nr:hypothetical protein [Caldisericia bacterium]HPB34596.1 hypothetical protein [Caldisericia bacterium]HQN48797.1 hypothetical protein [Caldisericia bacterium]HQO99665.1 hypothetical protein [Caldisericia bacterium]